MKLTLTICVSIVLATRSVSSHNQRILFLIIFSVFVFFDIKARCLLTTDTLALDTMRLSEVVVTASNVIRRRDSDLVLVTRDMRRGSFNTAEMLGKVPGFLYNRSTKSLSYYGEENVKILVDSLEKDAGYIKGLHHLRFDKLDVIPNPKGKYEGYAVLVNLHTRKSYEGYEGNLSGTSEFFPGGRNVSNCIFGDADWKGNLTYTKDRWNYVLGYAGDFSQQERNNFMETKYLFNNYMESSMDKGDGSKSHHEITRGHVVSGSVDCQLDKRNSVSLVYQLGLQGKDACDADNLLRSTIVGCRPCDTILSNRSYVESSYRHTLGIFSRGGFGCWNYTADLNVVLNGWDTESLLRKSSGYATHDDRRTEMNHTIAKFEVNRLLLGRKLYIAFGYNNFRKSYRQERLYQKDRLSDYTLWQNKWWLFLSCALGRMTNLSLASSIMTNHSRSGGFGCWNYTADLNVVLNGWDTESLLRKSSGYATHDDRRTEMNHTIAKFEVNRLLLGRKLYIAFGYNNFRKSYRQERLYQKDRLSDYTLWQNKWWLFLSCALGRMTNLSLASSIMTNHSRSGGLRDSYLSWSGSLGFFQRLEGENWVRLEYNCNVSNPDMTKVTGYGHFTDSLQWVSGNPLLRSSISHDVNLKYHLFKYFTVNGRFLYQPRTFTDITIQSEGYLENGVWSKYASTCPQNARWLSTWLGLYYEQRIGELSLSANVDYRYVRGKYGEFVNSVGNWTGNCMAEYNVSKISLYLSCAYNLCSDYNAWAQGLSKTKMDLLWLNAEKSFFGERLNVGVIYNIPLHFVSGKNISRFFSPAKQVYARNFNYNKLSSNSFEISITYRFSGGKSVRQYKRELSDEK